MIHGARKTGTAAVPSQAGCSPAGKGLNATGLQPAPLSGQDSGKQSEKRAATKGCL